MLVKVIKASQAIFYRGQALNLVRGELDAGGGLAGKGPLLYGVCAFSALLKSLGGALYHQGTGRLGNPSMVQVGSIYFR